MSLNFKPKVSILIPVFNRKYFIEDTIKSILNMDLVSDVAEICVYDDGSTDDSLSRMLKVYEEWDSSKPQLRVMSSRINSGVAYARNRLIDMAWGEYLMWHDSDDISAKKRLHYSLEFMEQNTDIDICFTGLRFFTDGNTPSNKNPLKIVNVNKYVNREGLYNNVNFPTAFFKRSLKKYEFDVGLKRKEDIVWLTRLIGDNIKFGSVNECLYYLRRHPGRLTYGKDCNINSNIF